MTTIFLLSVIAGIVGLGHGREQTVHRQEAHRRTEEGREAMKRTLFAATLFVAACAEPVEWQDNHGYGWYYNALTPAGWRVRWDESGYDPQPAYLTDPANYDSVWRRMKGCTGMDAPPAFIVLRPLAYIQARYGQNVGGRFHHSPPLLVSQEHGGAIPHEMGHYLLLMTTGYADGAHDHPMFKPGGCTFTVTFP